MKKLFWSLTIVFWVGSYFVLFFMIQEAMATEWQMSASAVMKLCIRDKFGQEGSYETTFYVTDPNRKTYSAVKRVYGDNWGCVTFPDDFNTFSREGKYSWKAKVKGRAIIGGRFEYNNSAFVNITYEFY